MVVSNIDESVIYAELKGVNPNDIKRESKMYQIMLYGLNIIIAVGGQKNTSKNISYFPIYLVKNTGNVIQIGVYEMLTNKVNKYIDTNNNLKVDKIDEPLVYSFATKRMIQKIRKIPVKKIKPDELTDDDDSSDDESENINIPLKNSLNIPESRRDIFIILPNSVKSSQLKEESPKDALDIRQKFHASSKDIWINQFMQNGYYFIDTIEGSDKCFFTAIKDAFSSIGQQTTVEKIRNKLASEITEPIYESFKVPYDMLVEMDIKCKTDIKRLQNRNAELKLKITQTINRERHIQIKKEGDENLERFNQLKQDKKMIDFKLNEYRFLKNVKTIQDFIKKFKTCDFWAETWAIHTVEQLLNIKFIIMSSDSFKQGDINGVLICGNFVPKEIFQPEYYIILNHFKNQYQIISYKNKQIFKYKELPFDLKRMILDKCVEGISGSFAMIPEFMNSFHGDLTLAESSENTKYIKYQNLFDDNIVFRYYEKSANNPPGDNNGEKLPVEVTLMFAPLASIPDWRKKLSNSWIQSFSLDGHKWASVQHYYEACKFKKNNPDFYLDFSLDSKTELSKNVDMAKSAGSKTGKYQGTVIREKHVSIDPQFYSNVDTVLYDAQLAKYTQNADLKRILMSTLNAKLIYHAKGARPEVAFDLMIVREELLKGSKLHK
jgi:predicted NAD-dependent protein-ADP-ribosyltransferase YbiA (DUF1768 family)